MPPRYSPDQFIFRTRRSGPADRAAPTNVTSRRHGGPGSARGSLTEHRDSLHGGPGSEHIPHANQPDRLSGERCAGSSIARRATVRSYHRLMIGGRARRAGWFAWLVVLVILVTACERSREQGADRPSRPPTTT